MSITPEVMNRSIQIPSPKSVISAAASLAATVMLVRSVAKDLIPHELRDFLFVKFHHFLSTFSNETTLVVDEFDGLNKDQLFRAAEIYLGTVIGPSTKRFRVSLPDKEKKINVAMERNEELCDTFGGFQLKWRMVSKQIPTRYVSVPGDYNPVAKSELRYYELRFHKKHITKVLQEYLPYVLEKSKAAKEQKKTLKLFTVGNDGMRGHRGNPWQSVNLDHPATFDTVAMDMDMKKMIIDDLKMFVGRKELYRKVGKAWKRGYLLFGPPGTGKSSLIAAMANYLRFDVYDLELADIRSNSELRRSLISTANHSILVVEDIDCSIELTEKRPAPPKPTMYPYPYGQGNTVTLSGLLNFIDGLWSSCGDERIIVFTTNHKEKLDPALLRPGRMDVHIHMSYCTPCGFKLLASNYLGITEHPLLLEVEQLMKVAKVTPAEVGEQLLKNSEPEIALKGLIEFLEAKKNTGEVEAYEKHQQASKAEILLKPEGGEIATVKEKGSVGLEIIKELIKMKKVPPAEVKKELMKEDVASIDLRGLTEFLHGKEENGEVEGSEIKIGASAAEILPVSVEKGESNSGST